MESVIVVVAVVSDPALARALIADWATDEDRAGIGPGRNASASLLARAASRALLARQTGRNDWRILRAPSGKPFVTTPTGAPGPVVSMSHTGDTAAVAIAPAGALGIDIERHRPRNFLALAQWAFGALEQAEVSRSGADGFYRIWTLREAVAKATGEGLAAVINGRDLVDGGVPGSYRRVERQGRIWHLAYVPIERDHSLGVAHADAPEEEWALRWCDLGESL